MEVENLQRGMAPSPGDDLSRALTFLLCALFVLATWTNAFAFNGQLPVPTLLLAAVFTIFAAAMVSNPRKLRPSIELHDIFFAGFLALTAISAAVSPNAKTINYIFAYTFTFAGMAILLRWVLVSQVAAARAFLGANAMGVLVVAVFCLVEFICRYHLAINIHDVIPRSVDAIAVYYNYPRVYGFAEEPTYLSWHLNTLGALAVYFVWARTKHSVLLKALYSSLVLTTWLFTFSAAGYVFLGLGLVAGICEALWRDGLHNSLKNLGKPAFWGGALLTVILSATQVTMLTRNYGAGPALATAALGERIATMPGADGYIEGYNLFITRWRGTLPPDPTNATGTASRGTLSANDSPGTNSEPGRALAEADTRPSPPTPTIVPGLERAPLAMSDPRYASGNASLVEGLADKFTLSETHGTPRLERWLDHTRLAWQKPLLGWGPGYFSSIGEHSSLNFFIFVAAEQGLPAAVMLLLGLAAMGWRIAIARAPYSGLFLMAFVAGVLHLLTMTQHYHPAVWLLLASFFMLESERGADRACPAGYARLEKPKLRFALGSSG